MSIFTLASPCPIFAPVAGDSDMQSIVFQRAAHLLSARAITVNSAGETILSFLSVASVTGAWQPQGGALVRMIQGTAIQIDAMFYVLGNPDLQVADRCTVSNASLEIVSTQHYGTEHAEIALRHVGR